MRNLILIAALFAVLSCVSADAELDLCSPGVDKSLFYLCPFTQIPAITVSNSLTQNITFSVVKENVPNCETNDTIYATYESAVVDCQDVASKGTLSYALIDPTDPNQGLNITYPLVTDSSNNTYQLFVVLKCNMSQDDLNATTYTLTDNVLDILSGNYTYTITAESKYGCPVFSLNKIIDFIGNNKYAFSAVFGVIGIILTFFGLKLFKIAVFVIAAILGTVISGSLFFQLTSLGSAPWILWAVFAVSIILGIVLGVLAIKLEKVGFFCVGGSLGFVGGLMLYNAVISPLLKSSAGTIPLYATIVICALIGGIIAFYVFESILIIATALIGSYFVVRVISIYAGGFPNEAYVAEGLEKFDAITYAYLAGIVVLAILGMVFQFKRKSAIEEEQEGGNQGTYAYYKY